MPKRTRAVPIHIYRISTSCSCFWLQVNALNANMCEWSCLRRGMWDTETERKWVIVKFLRQMFFDREKDIDGMEMFPFFWETWIGGWGRGCNGMMLRSPWSLALKIKMVECTWNMSNLGLGRGPKSQTGQVLRCYLFRCIRVWVDEWCWWRERLGHRKGGNWRQF